MSLARGRPYLAIPGPSVMPDRVLNAMHRAAPNIYEGDLIEMTAGIVRDLRAVACTEGHVAIYAANGHGAWEAALANTVRPDGKVLALATGRFGEGWAKIAEGLGLEVELLDFGKRATIDPDRLRAALRADRGGRIAAVLATHVDTATTVRNDIGTLRQVLDEEGHPALLMADCIASLACDRFEMDAMGADVMVAASQKGLMVPPGLGLVFFNDRAAEARARLPRVSVYWDWAPRAAPEHYYQYFGGTAPTHHLFGLRAALDMLAEEGLQNVWARHATLARAIWAACARWGEGGPLELNIADPALRSHAVTALRIGAPHGANLRRWMEEEAGVTLGIGLGMAEPGTPETGGFFRIAHMGHLNPHMVLGLLGSLEAGMRALSIPFAPGGVEAAAEVVAEATAPARRAAG
ncbi:pyridoxal-phosphate-dependent aminotransferase family protein [Rhodosalinus sp.]|uniref:pyridoxal-phosphate-dependent aminotransferase family protein n=1 Tax=Rhodosalinus sp. TaxID=2047741 RepID=UPI00397D325F